jgi:hypothetical protein
MKKAILDRGRKIAESVTLPAATGAIAESPLLVYPDITERYRLLEALTPAERESWAQLRARMLLDYLIRCDAVMALPAIAEAAA